MWSSLNDFGSWKIEGKYSPNPSWVFLGFLYLWYCSFKLDFAKKVELHYVTSVTTWNLEPPPGAAKTGKEFCSVVFLGFFWFAFSSCYTCYTSRKNIGKHLGPGGFCGEVKKRRFWKEKSRSENPDALGKRWKGMDSRVQGSMDFVSCPFF